MARQQQPLYATRTAGESRRSRHPDLCDLSVSDPQTTEEVGGQPCWPISHKKTWGMAFFIKDKETNSLGQVMGTIGVTLHNQCGLGYYPPPPENGPAGKYRKSKVQLLLPKGTPGMHIYARTGYHAPEPQ